jgi:hypothetical protein
MNPDSAYRHSPRTRRILAGLIPAACPPEALTLGLEQAIVDHVELSMRSLPAPVRAALLSGLLAYDAGALARHGRRSCRLDAERAQRYFAAWRHGLAPMREFAKAIKGLLCLAHYEMPAVQESLGYTPEAWIDAVKRRRLAAYRDDIRRHEERLLEPEPLSGLPGLADLPGLAAGATEQDR